jgi:prepilin-type N-terminal cleavage/methylation domain-containing protein
MTTYRTRHAFTLIELLIVIGLLGALAALMLPLFDVDRVESLEEIVSHDLAAIQQAFQRLHRDAVLDEADLDEVRRYGLVALFERPVSYGTNNWTLDEYDADRQRGWRGTYAQQEGGRTIDPDSDGQDHDGGTVSVPVIETPFATAGDDGHYYRVLAPERQGGGYVYREMLIVCPGADGKLDIVLPELAEGGTLGDLDSLTAGTDDTAWRLCPYVE